jgi:hypothetical protein
MPKKGFVYAFYTPSYPYLLKIGQTSGLYGRLFDANNCSKTFCLNISDNPENYHIVSYIYVEDCERIEKWIFRGLDRQKKRFRHKREFFCVKPDEIQEIFDLADTLPNPPRIKPPHFKTITDNLTFDDFKIYLKDGMKIENYCDYCESCIGTYSLDKNKIIYNGNEYDFYDFLINTHDCDWISFINKDVPWKYCRFNYNDMPHTSYKWYNWYNWSSFYYMNYINSDKFVK